jgi:anti-anti-sigma factor
MEMELRRSTVGQRHVLVVTGDVDLVSLPRFNDALARLISEASGTTVAVDLDGAGMIEDAALGLLLGTAGRARGAGGDLVVVATEPRLRARLQVTRFDQAVTVASSVASA